jgi:hypothetical protein
MTSDDSKEELPKRVKDWLEHQGYPLEMRVASALRRRKLWVRQSTHYIDQESGKSREIDVVAVHEDNFGVAEAHFIIECKASNKPWVLFTSHHTMNNFNRTMALGVFSQKARASISNRFTDAVHVLKWLNKDGRVGYNLTSAFTTGEDTAFGAASTVVKACLASVKAAQTSAATSLVFAFPAIVIGAPLLECYLDDDAELRVSQIEQGWLFFDTRIAGFHGTCIRVVSQNALDQYAADVRDMDQTLFEFIAPDIKNEWEAFNSGLKKRRIRSMGIEP